MREGRREVCPIINSYQSLLWLDSGEGTAELEFQRQTLAEMGD